MEGDSSNRTTIRDIAGAAGVSHTTVSRALRDSSVISPPTKKRIQELAEEMGYVPDPTLSALMRYRDDSKKGGPSVRVALVVARFMLKRWKAVKATVEAKARRMGHGFELYVWEPDISGKRQADILKARGIKGIIWGPLTGFLDCERLEIAWDDFSFVTIGGFMETPLTDCVDTDDFGVVRMALQMAESHGCKRPGLLSLERVNLRTQDRLRSSFDAYMIRRQKSDQVSPLLVGHDGFEDDIDRWIEEEKVDCVIGQGFFCEVLKKLNYRVPQDISFIATDLVGSQLNAESPAGIANHDTELASLAMGIVSENIATGVTGLPKVPKSLTLSGYWNAGYSLPER